MYGWIWRRLPEPLALRLLTAALLVVGAGLLLVGLVFPWAAAVWPIDRPELHMT